MSLFYICSETNCDRKYKTLNGLISHLQKIHKIIEITKENKKNIVNMKQVKQRELLIKEIAVENQLELIAKLEAEDLYKKQLEEKYNLIEEQKLRVQDEQLIIDANNYEKLK